MNLSLGLSSNFFRVFSNCVLQSTTTTVSLSRHFFLSPPIPMFRLYPGGKNGIQYNPAANNFNREEKFLSLGVVGLPRSLAILASRSPTRPIPIGSRLCLTPYPSPSQQIDLILFLAFPLTCENRSIYLLCINYHFHQILFLCDELTFCDPNSE